MTIWEKAILNMERGSKKLSVAAALFAERVKAEISIIRLRIRTDEVQNRIDELYQGIGRRVVNLALGDALPKTTEHLFQDEEITSAMADLKDRKQELEDLNNEIKNEKDLFKTAQKGAEVKTP